MNDPGKFEQTGAGPDQFEQAGASRTRLNMSWLVCTHPCLWKGKVTQDESYYGCHNRLTHSMFFNNATNIDQG